MASTAVIVAASVIAAGMGAGARWVFELLAATGVLLGLGVAFGAFDRQPSGDRARRRGSREPVASPELVAAVRARLQALDPVEHRQLDLGSPWPTVVVGPTGVSVVSVAGRVTDAAVARLEQVVTQVRHVAGSLVSDRPVSVAGLLVVPDDETVAAASPQVRTVAPAELGAAIARGPMVSMATVADLFTRLSGELVPDLRADAV